VRTYFEISLIQTSWVDKMIERVWNLIKLDRKKEVSIGQSPTPKRSTNKANSEHTCCGYGDI